MRRFTRLATLSVLGGLTACGGFLPGGDGDGGFEDGGARDFATGGSDSGGSNGGGGVQAKFSSLYGDYFGKCGSCHAPAAPGRTADIETTLDFSTVATAHQTITKGKAMNLIGNHMDCNSVPFIQPTAAQSLIYAVVDGKARQVFDLAAAPKCDESAISDETVKVGSQPSPAFLGALKKWIEDGAPND
ncbi:MAG: hypothetical protein EXR72_17330 [Myxococcales bacterium]|nr:hypothetical protein [Myxococcales bacterium]